MTQGGWIALSARGDKFYDVAARSFGAIRDEPLHLITSDYVLDESLTHLQRHFGHQGAVQFGRWILGNDRVEVTRVDEEIWEAAWEMFQAYEDKEWSFTDCTSFCSNAAPPAICRLFLRPSFRAGRLPTLAKARLIA